MNVPEDFTGPPPPLERAVLLTLAREGVEEAEVSVTLLGDEQIADLHARFLDRSGATDVLSFALHSGEEPPLGDIYIGYETAGRAAVELGLPLGQELVRLAVHGTLHILGHDHPLRSRESSPMFRRQEELVRQVFEQGGEG